MPQSMAIGDRVSGAGRVRSLRVAGITAAIAGAILFAWSIRQAGARAVVDGVSRVGGGFALVFALGGLRHVVRTLAWTLCIEPPNRLPLGAAFAAYLAGDSLGNVTPFGFLISEPSKIVLVRNRIAPAASIAALAVENVFYTLTMVLVLVGGTVALLWAFPVPPAVRAASLAVLGGASVLALGVVWIMTTKRPVASGVVGRLTKRDAWRRHLEPYASRVRDIEDRVFRFASRHRARVLPLLALESLFHASAVLEIWIVLTLIIGTAPTLLTAFVLEYVNRTITSVFQFVPMWLGVDEAGTGLVASVLQLGPATGVSLALVRKARVVVWTALGIALLVKQGFSIGRAVREAETIRS